MRSTAAAAIACVFLMFISCKPAVKFVTIGVDNSPPFYIVQSDGSVKGMVVEVLSEAARRRGIQIHWVPVTNTSLDEALTSGLVQMWPAVGATSQRKTQFYLSEPWLETDYVLVSPNNTPVPSIYDGVGIKVSHAHLRGTAMVAARFLSKSQLVVLPNRTQAVQEMCRGNVAAVLIESRMLETMLLDRPLGCSDVAFRILTIPGATTPLSIAATPESAALARELRSEISAMALNGEFGTILDRWAPFSAEVARSIGIERTAAVKNKYLTSFACGSLAFAMLLGLFAYRAYRLRRIALAAENAMRRQVAEDVLTRLASRTVFSEHLTRCIKLSHLDAERIFGVFFLDLDHFKVINDSLGHLAGDQLLIGIARRLKDLLGHFDEPCTVARLGGDEFVVLIESIQSPENALRIAKLIQHDMSPPFLLEGRPVFTTFSIGVALSSPEYQSAEEMLRDADTAMYAAKTSGKARIAFFDSAMRARAVARLEIESDLRVAITSRELIIHYQPQIDLRSGKIAGFEALVRWQHPKHGLIPPLDFIPIAEETGLIVPLGAWVLEEACSQMKRWQTASPYLSDLRISVNVSGKQLSSRGLYGDVELALRTSLLPPECLNLEITESFLMEDTDAAIQTLLRLKTLGVGLQIDDFGTGYSSLSYLHRLPFDTLKIDRSFVGSMGAEEEGIEIVRTIMTLAKSLKMSVVAEGVESEIQLSSLQQLGCEFAQGYYFSKPLSSSSAEILLTTRSRVRTHLPEFLLAS